MALEESTTRGWGDKNNVTTTEIGVEFVVVVVAVSNYDIHAIEILAQISLQSKRETMNKTCYNIVTIIKKHIT